MICVFTNILDRSLCVVKDFGWNVVCIRVPFSVAETSSHFCVYSYLDIYLGSDYHVFGAEKKTLRFEHFFGIMKVLEVGNMERTRGKGRDMEGTKQQCAGGGTGRLWSSIWHLYRRWASIKIVLKDKLWGGGIQIKNLVTIQIKGLATGTPKPMYANESKREDDRHLQTMVAVMDY